MACKSNDCPLNAHTRHFIFYEWIGLFSCRNASWLHVGSYCNLFCKPTRYGLNLPLPLRNLTRYVLPRNKNFG